MPDSFNPLDVNGKSLLGHLRSHPAEIDGQPYSGKQTPQSHNDPPNPYIRTPRPKEPEKKESDRQIRKSPKHVTKRRRFPNPGRRAKRRLKPMAPTALNKMRAAV